MHQLNYDDQIYLGDFVKVQVINERVLFVASLSFLILITIGYLTTNIASRLFVDPLRWVSMCGVVAGLGIALSVTRVNPGQLIALALYFFLLLWGVMLSLLNGSLEIGLEYFLTNTLVTVSGIVLFGFFEKEAIGGNVVRYFVVYILLGLIVTLLMGGLSWDIPPIFNFEYASDSSMEYCPGPEYWCTCLPR